MEKSEVRKIIREEIQALNEATNMTELSKAVMSEMKKNG